VENAVVWGGVVVLGLALASWAKFAIDRNSVDEREAHLVPPVVLTGIFLFLVVVAAVAAG
jgi:hypothetical protein